jgi:DNA primase
VHKLLRQASRIVFCFDGDAAGRKAAWRALEASLEPLTDDKTVAFLFLPPEHDPDSFVRSEGTEAFQNLVRQPTTLTEFLMRELKAPLDLGSAEGRARLVHEAKPYLTKLAAPILRVQLTKAVAEAASMAQNEVEAQCGLKPLTRGRPAPPKMRNRPAARSIEYALLEIVARIPGWAARLPLDLIDRERSEGAALLAIADAIDHGELPAGGFGLLLEYFRGSPHEVILASVAPGLAEQESDSAPLDAVFSDAVARLQQAAVAREIEALTNQARTGLNASERTRLTELLSKKQAGLGASSDSSV